MRTHVGNRRQHASLVQGLATVPTVNVGRQPGPRSAPHRNRLSSLETSGCTYCQHPEARSPYYAAQRVETYGRPRNPESLRCRVVEKTSSFTSIRNVYPSADTHYGYPRHRNSESLMSDEKDPGERPVASTVVCPHCKAVGSVRVSTLIMDRTRHLHFHCPTCHHVWVERERRSEERMLLDFPPLDT